jgi:hypothetical protein
MTLVLQLQELLARWQADRQYVSERMTRARHRRAWYEAAEAMGYLQGMSVAVRDLEAVVIAAAATQATETAEPPRDVSDTAEVTSLEQDDKLNKGEFS